MTTPNPSNPSFAQEIVRGVEKLAQEEGSTVKEKLDLAYKSQLGSKAVRFAENDIEASEE